MRNSLTTSALVGSLTAFLSVSPNVVAAPPPQAQAPPPLPPDTVDQRGLGWDLHTIGYREANKPFRFSLCEGRYLAAHEISRPCNQSNNGTIRFGHDAPFVFSAGHNQFLPKGLSIDGNGILHGDDPKLLSRLASLPLCVRQLDVERCKTVKVAKNTALEQDEIVEPIYNGSGPPKKGAGGMGFGKALVTTVGLTAAVAGGIYAYQAAKELDGGGGSCGGVTRSACCSGAGSGCGIPSQCQCPGGLRDGGICQAGGGCSNFMSPGSRVCNGC